ncbi:hypothetical protein UFOVP53_69 [uncultured Caudovirales phage]|uniref:Uncharacterized protein n=1 Tax=uncultured Caudovirales phage TaxID=2100421 RepID=A0A6J5KY47_9CAUD|nr:hypothetical protein UFOVP53_69 [uncultured Caudovirales phage]
MIIYKVRNGNAEVEFLTLQEANAYIASLGLSAVAEELDSPDSTVDVMASLELASIAYIDFGTDLWGTLKRKTWAFNTFLKISGTPLTTQEMQTLLTTSSMIEKCLLTGSLLTGKDVLNSLKNTLPRYTMIADFAIRQINTFLGV